MQIISNNIDFELPTDFAAELTRNNVMLTDAGEQTSPITLPGVPNNLKLVQNSDRLDNYYKPLSDLTVTVIDGLMNRQCNMGIHSANEVDGISCTLYFETGSFYSKVAEKKLASLPWKIIKPSLNPTYPTHLENNAPDTLENRVKWCINKLKYQYTHKTSEDWFKIFPVLTTQEYTWKFNRIATITPGTTQTVPVYDEFGNPMGNWDESGNWIPITETIITPPVTTTSVETKTAKFQLNGFETENVDTLPTYDYRAPNSINITDFQGEKIQKVSADSAEITLPLGYGMTPFLTVKFILENIFAGYTLNVADITGKMTGYITFYNEVVINTVTDAIVQGQINPAQLVPDVTVKDFLAFCEKRYAGKFVINEVAKTATFVSFNVLTAIPDMDLSTYLTAKAKQGSTAFEKITIKYSTDLLVDTVDSEDKNTTIDFDFYKLIETEINKAFCNSDQTEFYYVNLKLNVIDVGELVNKNTSLIIDGKTVIETNTTPTDIKILNFDPYSNYTFKYVNNNPITFNTEKRRTYSLDSTPQHPDVKTFYIPYINFKLNSNIPLTAEMNIPALILEKINIHTPKLLNGQPVMIESIKYALGKTENQTVTLRTLRQYADRIIL